ncbi:MAG TPA: EamA family transporter, partial [Giesbergeria sp.]|nr:EamA family transporter [Giesbergeria sp.]
YTVVDGYAVKVLLMSPILVDYMGNFVRVAPLSHVAPAREVSMLFAALIGGHLLGEGDRLARLCGAACIALGVTALALG